MKPRCLSQVELPRDFLVNQQFLGKSTIVTLPSMFTVQHTFPIMTITFQLKRHYTCLWNLQVKIDNSCSLLILVIFEQLMKWVDEIPNHHLFTDAQLLNFVCDPYYAEF